MISIANLNEIKKNYEKKMLGYPLRYEENPIRKESLESLMEEIVDSNDI